MPAKRLKVIVIDDDSPVADTLAMVLQFSGYDALAAYSGEHGLDLAREKACDHLITDVMMEPMNGIQAAIAIREICPECSVLLMSGHSHTSKLLADAVQDGHQFDVLPKPVKPSAILARLRGDREKLD